MVTILWCYYNIQCVGWYRSKFNHTLSGIPGMGVRYAVPLVQCACSAIPDVAMAIAVSLAISGLLLHPTHDHWYLILIMSMFIAAGHQQPYSCCGV